MSNYFENFPVVDYNFGDEDTSARFQHIGTAIDILDQVKRYNVYYQTLEIQNGERPEQLSQRLYENVNYYWTFYLLNDHLRTGGWPIRDADLWPKAQQYYPHTVISTSAVVQEKIPKLIDTGSEILVEYVPTENQKPLCTSKWVRVGNWVWFKYSKKAGQILKIDQKTGYITVDVKDIRGVEQEMEVIEEEEALQVLDNPDYVPVKRHEEIQIFSVMDEFDAPHHFEDVDGNWIWPEYDAKYPHPLRQFKGIDIDGVDGSNINTINSISNYQRLRQLNQKQKVISVIKKDTITQIVREFNSLLKQR